MTAVAPEPMTALTRGGNAPVPGDRLRVSVEWGPGAMPANVAAFLSGVPGQEGASTMVSGRMPGTAGVTLSGASAFDVDLASVPSDVERIAFTGSGKAMDAALVLSWTGGGIRFELPVMDGGETAVVLGELYRRNGQWKFRAVGQGYAAGFVPLARSFGVDVSGNDPFTGADPVARRVVDLRKRTVDLTKRDPDLGTHAGVALGALEAAGLAGVTARFALVLDISASMRGMFRNGKVDKLVARALAVGLQMDDDGEIDVFVFGAKAHSHGPLTETTYKGFAAECERRHGFESDTLYGQAIGMVREHYRRTDNGLPVYVMFVTDGGTRDVRVSKDAITAASREPLFWQFMAIGEHDPAPGVPALKIGRSLPRGFDFLAMLDTMEGRLVDNANFFAVEDPATPSDHDLYGMMFAEFPQWLAEARRLRIVKDAR